MKHSYKILILLAAIMFIFIAADTMADVPNIINLQGRLLDDAGDPYPASQMWFVFWIEDQYGTMFTDEDVVLLDIGPDGLWSYNFGSNPLVPIDDAVFEDSARYLQILLDDDGVPPTPNDDWWMPLVKLTTQPYTFRLGTVDSASGGEVTSTIYAPELELGSPSQNGNLEVYLDGAPDPVIIAQGGMGYGGYLEMFDENTTTTVYEAADANGSGGYFAIVGGPGGSDFVIDGNSVGSGSPRIGIQGTGGYASFNTYDSGDNSVWLSGNAIGNPEILDEPGAASFTNAGTVYLSGGGYETVASQSITVPDGGYVMAVASFSTKIFHVNGTPSSLVIGISENSTSLASNQDVDYMIPSGATSGSYFVPGHLNALFDVSSSGTYIYYILGDESSGNVEIADIQFNLVFIPTAYGTVYGKSESKALSDNENTRVGGLTEAEIAETRAQSETFNAQRIEKELTEMQILLEELKNPSGQQWQNGGLLI